MSEVRRLDLSAIDDAKRPFVTEWLRDRSAFHTWFSSLIAGSFVVLTVFGNKPGFGAPGAVFLSVAVALLLLSLICNLVCVWSIPSWKFRVSTGALKDGTAMRRELFITAWVGVVAYVCGLTLAFIGNTPG
jgi:hypothetical protein